MTARQGWAAGRVASARTRVLFVGAGAVALLGYFAVCESLARLIGFAIVMGVYSLVLVMIESGLGNGRSRSNDVFAVMNALGATAARTLAGQLGGPLLGIYVAIVLGATLVSGRRTGFISGATTCGSWLLALGASWAGWAPGLQPTMAPQPTDPFGALLAGSLVFAVTGYTAWAYARSATERLCEAENRYRTVLEATKQPILLVDPTTGRYVDANRAATGDIAGGNYDRLLDLTVYDVLDESEHGKMSELLAAVAERGPRPVSQRQQSPVGADCGEVVSATCEVEGRPVLVVAGRAGEPV